MESSSRSYRTRLLLSFWKRFDILGHTLGEGHRPVRRKLRFCRYRKSAGVAVLHCGPSIPIRFRYGHGLGRLRSEYRLRPARLVAEDLFDHVHHAFAAELFKANLISSFPSSNNPDVFRVAPIYTLISERLIVTMLVQFGADSNAMDRAADAGQERGRHWSVVAAADSPSPLQSPFPWLWSLCPPSASRWLRSIGVPKFAGEHTMLVHAPCPFALPIQH